MIDIKFFQDVFNIKQEILADKNNLSYDELFFKFESLRNRKPFVFNIETTNVCNMDCVMCPRPKLMRRKIQHMDMGLFEKVVKQIKPHSDAELRSFWDFVVEKYGVLANHRNENAFYFYTVVKSLTLHGFGEPLLDPYMDKRISLCSELGIPTYFSCVPANISVEKVWDIIKAGLGTIKFSIDSLTDSGQKKVRGKNNNFIESYDKICELIKLKSKDKSVKTEFVVTMVALSDTQEDRKMYSDFMKLWHEKPVFAYIKSQDNRWFHEDDEDLECKSHYESQYCEFPWLSLTVMADGTVVPCSQDYNCEMSMGNAGSQTLEEVWNSAKFDQLRKLHIKGLDAGDWKCYGRCDIKTLNKRLGSGEQGILSR
ncbi:MAG: SPASM domain-containing protein [Candidatus Omnitrophica bacterium]|nr:SPASM domain-containing protein [Candidatus Omnitrophota bacterium]